MNTSTEQYKRGTSATQSSTSQSALLTVPQLAELLHVNEKKIYQLAGCGEIPGTKVTGKWIFPRQLIDDWLLENSHGGVMHDRLLIGGSDDRFVHQICSNAAIEWQQHALVSYSPSGTRHGLRMLDAGRLDACFINWGASEPSARRHLALLRCYRNHHSWVIVRVLTRNQGIVLNHHLSSLLNQSVDKAISHALNKKTYTWALRQNDSGTERLLQDLCSTHGMTLSDLNASTSINSERGALASVNTGQADASIAAQSMAAEYNLPYLPVANVSLDLVMTRKTYFRTLVQDFISRLSNDQAIELANEFGGYDLLQNTKLLTID